MNHDYTPLPDVITQTIGINAAAVYGRVWRFCQIGGECTAAIQTISDELGISAPTVQKYLNALVEDGYLTKRGSRRDGRPSTYRLTGKWVMGGHGGLKILSTQVESPDLPTSQDSLDPSKDSCEGVERKFRGGRKNLSTRDIPSSSSSEPFMPVTEEEGSRAPVHTRPAPKPDPLKPTNPSAFPDFDPDDEMQAAFLEGCGLDPELTRSSVLISVADYAGRLRRRKFTADEIREAAATWHEFLPHRDPEDLEPPHPQQLAEWVARRRASKAMASATSRTRPSPRHLLVPFIET